MRFQLYYHRFKMAALGGAVPSGCMIGKEPMTSARKEHVKSLKAPDPFQVKLLAGLEWTTRNLRLITIVAAPVGLVVAGFFLFQFVQGKRKDSRLQELAAAQIAYDTEARKVADQRREWAKRVEAIDQELGKPVAAGKDQPAPTAAPDPKLAAEKAELEKKAEAIRPDHGASAQLFTAYFKKYEAYPEGWSAGTQAATIAIEAQQFEVAKGLLGEVLAQSTASSFHQTQARVALVGVLEELGDFDGELGELSTLEKALAQTKGADLLPKLQLARGRAQILKGAKAEAKTTLTTLLDTYGTSQEAQTARALLATLPQ